MPMRQCQHPKGSLLLLFSSHLQVSLFFSESPTYPCLRCVDIPRVKALCKPKVRWVPRSAGSVQMLVNLWASLCSFGSASARDAPHIARVQLNLNTVTKTPSHPVQGTIVVVDSTFATPINQQVAALASVLVVAMHGRCTAGCSVWQRAASSRQLPPALFAAAGCSQSCC